MMAIAAKGVAKQYKNGVQALAGLDFTVGCGEIFSLLGPNGAGKSTLINILTTYSKPNAGVITLLGKDLVQNPRWVRTQIACAAQQVSIDTHLSLMENLQFQCRLYQVAPHEAKKRIVRMIETFCLSDYQKYPVSSYSGGVKRRLDIAMNMVSLPKILFLDEPSAGMDVQSRKAMWDMLRTVRSEFGTTIFLTTHYLEEAEALCDTVCIMKKGKALVQGTPCGLRSIFEQNMLRIAFGSKAQAKEQILKLSGKLPVQDLRAEGSDIIATVDSNVKALPQVNQLLLDSNTPFTGIEVFQPRLEDVFLFLTGKDGEPVCSL